MSDCCKGWAALTDRQRSEFRWQMLHELSHSRVPFSQRTAEEIARVDSRTADQMIRQAAQLRWLVEMGDQLFMGALSRKR